MILYTGALDVLKNLELFPSETFWQKEYPIKQKPIVYKNNYVYPGGFWITILSTLQNAVNTNLSRKRLSCYNNDANEDLLKLKFCSI